jgi:hypothetical protein
MDIIYKCRCIRGNAGNATEQYLISISLTYTNTENEGRARFRVRE